MNNKRAVSAVVATVLIIMITVAAVGIIWATIIPLIRTSIDKGTACFDAQSDISLVTNQGYTCINGTNLSLQVKKGSNDKISLVGIQALVFVGGDSQTYRFNKTNNTGNLSGSLPGNNEEKVLTINGSAITNATRVKIAPIVTVGRTEEICEAGGEVVLSPCA